MDFEKRDTTQYNSIAPIAQILKLGVSLFGIDIAKKIHFARAFDNRDRPR